MKLIVIKEEKFIEEGNSLTIEDLNVELTKEDGIKETKGIDLENLSLHIENNPELGRLTLDFFREKYSIFKIIISSGEIFFSRLVQRPNHDHDDTQEVYIDKETELKWLTRDYEGKRKKVKIPFGDIIKEY